LTHVPIFHVVPGSAVKSAIDGNRQKIFEAVEATYRLHAAGQSVNPSSYFLRYPDNPSARIIALPAHLGGEEERHQMDIELPGQQGRQPCARVGSPDFERRHDGLSTGLH
jgi:hypothetical protein